MELNGSLRSRDVQRQVEVLPRQIPEKLAVAKTEAECYKCCSGRVKENGDIKSLCKKDQKIIERMFFSIFFLWCQHGETEDKGLLSNALKIFLPGQDEGGLDLRNFHFQEQTIKALRKDTKMIQTVDIV